MGNNVAVCVGVGGVYHYCNYCSGGVKGAEGELIALSLEESDHFVEIIDVQSHAEEAKLIDLVVTHKIHVVSVGIHQNVVLHEFGVEVVSNLQIEAFGQNLNS